MKMVNTTFTGQSAPGIRRKLQKLDGALGMKASLLVDVAFKVFSNREQQQKPRGCKVEPYVIGRRQATGREVSHHWGRNNVLPVRRKAIGRKTALS